MNKLKKIKQRLFTYYCYFFDVLDQLQEQFPSMLLDMKQAETEKDIAFAAGAVAAHGVIIEKIVFYAHHFSISIDFLKSEMVDTGFEHVYNSILDNPQALQEKLHAYQAYIRELGIQFEAAHVKASYENAVWRKRADKVGQRNADKASLYGFFTDGQSAAFYTFRSRLRNQAMGFLISLKDIGMIDPIPVCPIPVSFLSSSSESVPE